MRATNLRQAILCYQMNSPAAAIFSLTLSFWDPLLLHRPKIEGTPIGSHQPLGAAAIPAERTLGQLVRR
ncbi:MAG: hypothetical protein OWS74_08125 [Firmicutes bacterium]|nr:hypothetical protein [Bacillota bacterium]